MKPKRLDIFGEDYVKLEIKGEVLKAYDSRGIVEDYDLREYNGLDCADNNLESIPRLPDRFVYLDCSCNNLTSLPKLPKELKSLVCSYNNLQTLPLLPESLLYLDCTENNIRDLQLPESLNCLECSANPLFWAKLVGKDPVGYQLIPNQLPYYKKYQLCKYLLVYLALEAKISPSIISNDHFWFLGEP